MSILDPEPKQTLPGAWDGLIFGFTASLTLWADLPAVEAVVVLIVLVGAALVALLSEERYETKTAESPEATGNYRCPQCGNTERFVGFDDHGFPGDECECAKDE